MIGEFIHAHKFLIGLLAGGFVGFWAGVIATHLFYEILEGKMKNDYRKHSIEVAD